MGKRVTGLRIRPYRGGTVITGLTQSARGTKIALPDLSLVVPAGDKAQLKRMVARDLPGIIDEAKGVQRDPANIANTRG
mgnify:CR=1 FL=1|jgi:hypothetical protein